MAGFRFFELGKVATLRDLVAEIYRGLGQFHGSGFASARKANSTELTLFERALLYFEEARTIHPECAAAFKEIGALHTVAGEGPPQRELARRAFERSLQLDPAEPGAIFGIGWIEYMDEKWDLAIDQYTKLIVRKEWREEDRRKYLPDSYLNRACVRARTLNAADELEAFDPILADCKKGLEVARELSQAQAQAFRERLENEINSGDLSPLQMRVPVKVSQLLA